MSGILQCILSSIIMWPQNIHLSQLCIKRISVNIVYQHLKVNRILSILYVICNANTPYYITGWNHLSVSLVTTMGRRRIGQSPFWLGWQRIMHADKYGIYYFPYIQRSRTLGLYINVIGGIRIRHRIQGYTSGAVDNNGCHQGELWVTSLSPVHHGWLFLDGMLTYT